MATFKFVDLFSGTGAFTHVMNASNRCKCVLSNDLDKGAGAMYSINYPDCDFILEDLNKLDVRRIPQHEILCGGFPCQPFSIAGEKKGFKDARSNVFWKIIEILDEHKPGIVLLENVKNLTSHDNCNTFNTITDQLSKLDYYVITSVLDTSKITRIPQHRERIYFVCFKDEQLYKRFSLNFPDVQNDNISDFLESDVDDKYYYNERYKVYDVIKEAVVKDVQENVIYQYRRYYVRENKKNLCPTLTANMGGGGHNVPLIKDAKGIRKLTPRECFNMQGFPADYKLPAISDSALYKLAGNAVSIPVIQLIVDRLLSLL